MKVLWFDLLSSPKEGILTFWIRRGLFGDYKTSIGLAWNLIVNKIKEGLICRTRTKMENGFYCLASLEFKFYNNFAEGKE